MEKNDKVSFEMIYSYEFKGLSIQIARIGLEVGAYLQDKIPVQELWPKMRGGSYAGGGVFAGHYGTCYGSFFVILMRVFLVVFWVFGLVALRMFGL